MNKIAEFFCRSAGFGWFCAEKAEEPPPTQLIVVKKLEDDSSYTPPETSIVNRMARGHMASIILEHFTPLLTNEIRQNGCVSSHTRGILEYINRDVPPLLDKNLRCPIDLRTGEDVLPIKVDKF